MKTTQQKVDEAEKKLTKLKDELKKESEKNDWIKIPELKIYTLLSKFLIALSFIIPILLFNLKTAIIISIIWGLLIISLISLYIAKKDKKPL